MFLLCLWGFSLGIPALLPQPIVCGYVILRFIENSYLWPRATGISLSTTHIRGWSKRGDRKILKKSLINCSLLLSCFAEEPSSRMHPGVIVSIISIIAIAAVVVFMVFKGTMCFKTFHFILTFSFCQFSLIIPLVLLFLS